MKIGSSQFVCILVSLFGFYNIAVTLAALKRSTMPSQPFIRYHANRRGRIHQHQDYTGINDSVVTVPIDNSNDDHGGVEKSRTIMK